MRITHLNIYHLAIYLGFTLSMIDYILSRIDEQQMMWWHPISKDVCKDMFSNRKLHGKQF